MKLIKLSLIALLSTISLQASSVKICNTKINIGSTYNLRWIKEDKNRYKKQTDKSICTLYTNKSNQITKVVKTSKIRLAISEIPKTIKGMKFKAANIVTSGLDGVVDKKYFKSLLKSNKYIKTNSKKIKFFQAVYSNGNIEANVFNLCQIPGFKCQLNIEYTKQKGDK